jgi:AcrR family transcriptional regulator
VESSARSQSVLVPSGRRARNKQDKHQRIFDAASALFTGQGYSSVTTQMVADRADVGTGTLFRYASSKAELLMMVMNEQMRLTTRQGVAESGAAGSPGDAIMALLQPQIHLSLAFPENTAVYQREILFGTEQGRYRTEALARISELEDAIGNILARFAQAHRVRDDVDLDGAARTVFSTLHMELIRVSLGRKDPQTLTATLGSHIDVLLFGILDPE